MFVFHHILISTFLAYQKSKIPNWVKPDVDDPGHFGPRPGSPLDRLLWPQDPLLSTLCKIYFELNSNKTLILTFPCLIKNLYNLFYFGGRFLVILFDQKLNDFLHHFILNLMRYWLTVSRFHFSFEPVQIRVFLWINSSKYLTGIKPNPFISRGLNFSFSLSKASILSRFEFESNWPTKQIRFVLGILIASHSVLKFNKQIDRINSR